MQENNIECISNESLIFEYVETGSLVSLSPVSGNIVGGAYVELVGSNFSLFGVNAHVECLFGNSHLSAGTIQSDNIVSCEVPASSAEGPTQISLLVNGVSYGTKALVYTYVKDFSLTSLWPSVVSVFDETEITLSGGAFSNVLSYSCVFVSSNDSSISVPAWIVNTTSVGCVAPVYDSAGIFQVTAQVGDYIPSKLTNLSIEYVVPSNVISMNPQQGTYEGGTAVILTGDDFSQTKDYSCLFGSIKVPGEYQSANEIKCISPQGPLGLVFVSLLENNIFTHPLLAPLTFEYIIISWNISL